MPHRSKVSASWSSIQAEVTTSGASACDTLQMDERWYSIRGLTVTGYDLRRPLPARAADTLHRRGPQERARVRGTRPPGRGVWHAGGVAEALDTVADPAAAPSRGRATPATWVFRAGLGLLGAQCAFLVGYSVVVFHRMTLGVDFGIFSQAWTRIGTGHLDPTSSISDVPYLASHFELLMWPLALQGCWFSSWCCVPRAVGAAGTAGAAGAFGAVALCSFAERDSCS